MGGGGDKAAEERGVETPGGDVVHVAGGFGVRVGDRRVGGNRLGRERRGRLDWLGLGLVTMGDRRTGLVRVEIEERVEEGGLLLNVGGYGAVEGCGWLRCVRR